MVPENKPKSQLHSAGKRGASMADIARLKDPEMATPAAALAALKAGNERFFSGRATRPELNANERRAQIIEQTPFATILACSDSRVPVEIVFDQGLGDLFIVRVAGHVCTPATMGSLEYAITALKCHLIVVMGHEGCGAVRAAMLPAEETAQQPENIRYLLDAIRPAVAEVPALVDEKSRMREAVVRHVLAQVESVQSSRVVAQAVAAGRVAVVGCYYEIGSGAADFYCDEELLADEATS
ncbi:MAG: carbonic anhydrase [Xanthomonadales bacterium]|nr:carbonic anhydrase [Xanthomonadales bacterium]